MALGAVFLSLPMAMTAALYGWLANGMSTLEGLVTYATVGSAVLLFVTFANCLRFDDLR